MSFALNILWGRWQASANGVPDSGSSLVENEVWTDEAKERFENYKLRFRTADTDGYGLP
jgi:hypothetical protein